MANSNLLSKWGSFAPQFKSILRIVAAFMFLQSGTMKLFGWPMAMPGGMHLDLMSQMGIGAILEFVGGLLLLVGLCTRPIAFVLAGEMAVAYWQFHAPKGALPMINGGADAVLYCFIFLYLSASGGGPWSVDAMRGK